jgi:predicted enzyme related to lactoylglutathione lyase
MAAKKAKKKAKKAARKPVAKVAKVAKKAAKRSAAKKAPPRKAGPQIVHWEIQSLRPETLHQFYASVFGWKVDANNSMNYGMVSSGGGDGIDGGIGGSQTPQSRVLVYASVESIDDALARIASAGGSTIMPRTDVGPVIMALYTDPEGNVMGLIEG